MKSNPISVIVTTLIIFIHSGCSTPKPAGQFDRTPSNTSGAVCEIQHSGKTSDGEDVVICDRTFQEIPFVRPPADDLRDLNAAVLHVGLRIFSDSNSGISSFVDRSGNEYAWVDSKGKPVDVTQANPGLPVSMHLPSHRNLYLTYVVRGKITKRNPTDSSKMTMNIVVQSAQPEILISGCAMDSAFLGNWEGTVTSHSSLPFGPIVFSDEVPLQMTLDRVAPMRDPLVEWEGDSDLPHLPDGEINSITGHFTNLHSEVTSFLDLEKKLSPTDVLKKDHGPFVGVNLRDLITVNRMASMHTPKDEVVILYYPETPQHMPPLDLPGSGMDGDQQVWTPYSLIQNKDRDEYRTISVTPHGPPSGHRILLRWIGPGATINDCAEASK